MKSEEKGKVQPWGTACQSDPDEKKEITRSSEQGWIQKRISVKGMDREKKKES